MNDKAIALAAQKLVSAQRELEQAEKDKQDAIDRQEYSKLLVQKYLGEHIEDAMETGVFNSKHTKAYWQKFEGDKEAQYIRLAARLLTHPDYGLVSSDTKVRNVPVRWLGNDYSSPEALHDVIEQKLGSSPFESSRWFPKLMVAALKEPRSINSQMITDLKDKYTKPRKIEVDTDWLTTDDYFFLFHAELQDDNLA